MSRKPRCRVYQTDPGHPRRGDAGSRRCPRRCSSGSGPAIRSRDAWALPGGVLAANETLEASIRRHLATKVDLAEVAHLEQVSTYGDPGRNPVEWEIATAYLGLVPLGVDPSVPEDTSWHPVDDLPPTAFDHRRDHPLRPRSPARQALVHEHRLRPRPGLLHADRAPRRLRGGARLRRLGDEPEAGAAPAWGDRADGRAAGSWAVGWPSRRGVRVLGAGARGHRSVRRVAPTRIEAGVVRPGSARRSGRRAARPRRSRRPILRRSRPRRAFRRRRRDRKVGVRDRPADGVAEAAARHPAHETVADADRLGAQRNGSGVVERQAAENAPGLRLREHSLTPEERPLVELDREPEPRRKG